MTVRVSVTRKIEKRLSPDRQKVYLAMYCTVPSPLPPRPRHLLTSLMIVNSNSTSEHRAPFYALRFTWTSAGKLLEITYEQLVGLINPNTLLVRVIFGNSKTKENVIYL
jgi:hypothetical protein